MTDVQIRAFIRAQLLVLLPLYGMANVQVIADYQPTQQGRQILDMPGDQVTHVAIALPGALHRHQL